MNEEKKQELIDRYRNINVDYEWWDFTHEDFFAICKILGVGLDKHEPSFSGFWSQGDGASFTGSYSAHNADNAPAEIRSYAPDGEELHRIADELCLLSRVYYPAYASVTRSGYGNYVHSQTMYVSDPEPHDGDPEDWADEIHEIVEEKLQYLMRDLADWLYASLEKEYDHLTSDEVVWETIVANELDKEEEEYDNVA
jgi:hypothetical protein